MNMNSDDQAAPSERREPRSAGEARRWNEARSTGEVGAQSSLHGPAGEPQYFSPRSSNGPEHSVELDIEELVLHGFEPADRYAIGDAVERELTRLLGEQGSPIAPTEDIEIAHVNGGAINLRLSSNAEATGIQLARAIYGGLSE